MSKSQLDAMKFPEARNWAQQFDMSPSLLDFVSARASVNVVAALVNLFWPIFLEVRGCVLLPWAYDPDLFEQWWTKLSGEVPAIETTINHLHLWDVFNDDDDEMTVAYDEIGEKLRSTWAMQLQAQFPQREFDVRYVNDESEYGPTVSVITNKDK